MMDDLQSANLQFAIYFHPHDLAANTNTPIHTKPLMKKNKKPAIPSFFSHFFLLLDVDCSSNYLNLMLKSRESEL